MNESRIVFAVRTLEAASFLVRGANEADANLIARRARDMLQLVWKVEVECNQNSDRYFMNAFWDEVGRRVAQVGNPVIYTFEAIYNEIINPNKEHNVYIKLQPAGMALNLVLELKCP